MSYSGTKESNSHFDKNQATIHGYLEKEPAYDHTYNGENFYELSVSVVRYSGVKDIIPCIISENMYEQNQPWLSEGMFVSINGEVHTHHIAVAGTKKHKMLVFLFAHNIEPDLVSASKAKTANDDVDFYCKKNSQLEDFFDKDSFINDIEICGYICKQPIFRETPNGRHITDLHIAVNRPNGKSDYIPCICWGEYAYEAFNLPVGTPVTISGRFQSREYAKKIDAEIQTFTAYEVSISTLNSISKD